MKYFYRFWLTLLRFDIFSTWFHRVPGEAAPPATSIIDFILRKPLDTFFHPRCCCLAAASNKTCSHASKYAQKLVSWRSYMWPSIVNFISIPTMFRCTSRHYQQTSSLCIVCGVDCGNFSVFSFFFESLCLWKMSCVGANVVKCARLPFFLHRHQLQTDIRSILTISKLFNIKSRSILQLRGAE